MKTYKQFIVETSIVKTKDHDEKMKRGEAVAKKYLAKEWGGWKELEKALKAGKAIDVENSIEDIYWGKGTDEDDLVYFINHKYGWEL